jgi:type I restriction enzyme M protein
MSFVPAVFKKALDQYFTPISLIEAMVDIVRIGPNDIIADPAMGTADFLTAAMASRLALGEDDVIHRLKGADADPMAFDLAIINMILHKDGQSGFLCEDSIEHHHRWAGKVDVALCNPPFGENSIEKRQEVLAHYDLGHAWSRDDQTGTWTKTDAILPAQQLGILFIEKCFKLLSEGGRLAIILPEGFLCTASYGYVRQWILDNLRILCLVELPRRIFTRSEADLRGNILLAQRVSSLDLKELIKRDYPIQAELVRRVGFKMGKGYSIVPKRDEIASIPVCRSCRCCMRGWRTPNTGRVRCW